MKKTAENLEKNLRVLTDEIGVRLAGSAAEYKAAEFIAAEFRKYSDKVTIEEFPVNERAVISEKLEVMLNDEWIVFPCSLFGSAPSTDGKTVEADIVFFDTATGYQREDLSFLTGKAVVHLGCHIESEDAYRRLMEAKPAFILFVDTRYPGTIQLADGLFPAYAETYGAVPSLNVAYMDAWKWFKNKAAKAKVCIEGGIRKSKTTVVTCEITGTDPDAGVIYGGGHHDTQAGTVGADDNAVGSVGMIELARMLSEKKHKRTFKLISFGAEEQLSLGSAHYIRKHRREISDNGVFMYNLDSMGSALGWYEFTVNATDAMRNFLRESYKKHDIYYVELTEPCPYTDQFPFAACGVPGIWVFRKNCESGVFFHHRVDNDAEVIGFEDFAKFIHVSADILTELANREDISELKGIPVETQKLVDEEFNAVYGGF